MISIYSFLGALALVSFAEATAYFGYYCSDQSSSTEKILWTKEGYDLLSTYNAKVFYMFAWDGFGNEVANGGNTCYRLQLDPIGDGTFRVDYTDSDGTLQYVSGTASFTQGRTNYIEVKQNESSSTVANAELMGINKDDDAAKKWYVSYASATEFAVKVCILGGFSQATDYAFSTVDLSSIDDTCLLTTLRETFGMDADRVAAGECQYHG